MFALYVFRRKLSARNVRTLALARLFVMCEQLQMAKTPRTSELASAAGISRSYASEIVNGLRVPSRPLAIKIYRATGWRPSNIVGLSEADLATLERLAA